MMIITQKFRKKLFLFALFALISLFAVSFFFPELAFAQDGLDTVADTSGLSNTDPRLIVARIIRAILGVMGIIATCLILYAGFIWMTAGGESDRVDKAKRILINALIGLLIILASLAITQFVIGAITRATGFTGGNNTGGNPFGCLDCGGPGVGFIIEDFRPEGEVPIRNVVPRAFFSRLVDSDSLEGQIQVLNADTTDEIPVTYQVVGDMVKIYPEEACPAPHEDRFCFPSDTEISVHFLGDIQSGSGEDLICSPGAYECSFNFTTGDLVDVEDPDVAFTTPYSGERFDYDEVALLQVRATDDAGVISGEFYVQTEIIATTPAPAGDTTDVTLDATWYAEFYSPGRSYQLSSIVSDYADNTAQAFVSARINPAHCSDGVPSGDETDVDCGGSCGACVGDECTEHSDCETGLCLDNKCVEVPQITNVFQNDGAPGNFVTITGTGFGGLRGSVLFSGPDGTLVGAPIPACTDGWSSTSVIVEVPANAVTGPITLRNALGDSDSTDNTFGPPIPDFEVNDIQRPNLCRVSPSTGRPRSEVTLYGSGFGVERDSGTVWFDLSSAEPFTALQPESYDDWSADDAIRVTVPVLEQDDYLVTVRQDGETSNPAPYFIRFADDFGVDDAPRIQEIAPGSGPIGQYVTITGTNFGSSLGQVLFENTSDRSKRALGSIDFPSACSTDDIWQPSQIIVKVPDRYPSGELLSVGDFDVLVKVGAQESESVPFSVVSGDPGAQVCAISPRQGLAGDSATLYGENFGSDPGAVVFSTESSAPIDRWSNNSVSVEVPEGISGKVAVRPPGATSSIPEQGVYFSYGASDSDSGPDIRESGYGWMFSTGEIPVAPELIIACNDEERSGIPNEVFNPTVCRNVIVRAAFTTPMQRSSFQLGTTVNVYKCLTDDCSERDGPFTNPEIGFYPGTGNPTSVRISPEGEEDWAEPNTRYRIEFIGGDGANVIRSAEGEPMARTVAWEFVTGDADDVCTVEEVVVQPGIAVIQEDGGTAVFDAGAYAQRCVLLRDNFEWNWSVDDSFIASVEAGSCDLPEGFDQNSCAIATALSDGETFVNAADTLSGISDNATLRVRFQDPFLTDFWPNCNGSCLNAEVGGQFNIPVTSESLTADEAINIAKCENELCVNTTDETFSVQCDAPIDGGEGCIGFSLTGLALAPSSFYKVEISNSIVSLSAKSLIGTREWVFSTSDTVCVVENVLLTPGSATAEAIGDRQTFRATPLGEPDHCSVAGQRLDATQYDWNWQDPIQDKELVSEWVKPFLGHSSDVAPGCTTACLPVGSTPRAAVCGNRVLETGEECDDGNISSGDGCSISCLREGRVDSLLGSCGDGEISRTTLISQGDDLVVQLGQLNMGLYSDDDFRGDGTFRYGWLGEECDDGNSENGDGCSATCLNEGSRSIGSVCGNGDIAYDRSRGGEDCDDGNSRSGDGCSISCQYEGSVSIGQAPAVCGNGIIEEPYESCDDDNTSNGDGCSSACLREGIRGGELYRSLCGDGVINQDPTTGAGEDCDGGEGCGQDCRLLGSSLTYSRPSVCGDGVAGFGEFAACEGVAIADIGSDQVAEISETAPLQISVGASTVQSKIRVNPGDIYDDVTAEADYVLSCSARSANDCSDPDILDVGLGNCCVPRPNVQASSPDDEAVDVCRNALPSFQTDIELDQDSIFSSVRLTQVGGGACQHSIVLQDEYQGRPLYAIGHYLIGLFTAPPVEAQTDCIVPISSVDQIEGGGSNLVYVYTNQLFAADTTYEFRILGEEDSVDDALRSTLAGKMLDTWEGTDKRFTVGTEICEVNFIQVDDPEGDPPGFFGVAGDSGSREFSAQAISVRGGIEQPIQQTPEYSWTWGDWNVVEDAGSDIVDVSDFSASTQSISTATVTPETDNGEASVIASLTISGASAGLFCDGGDRDGESCVGEDPSFCSPGGGSCQPFPLIKSGALDVETFFCERPWPSLTTFPFQDTELGDDGVVAGPGDNSQWTDFSTYYCMDAGVEGSSEDLPALQVSQPNVQTFSDLQKEFLFNVVADDDNPDVRGDVIGVRVIENPLYLSPVEWYRAQGFEGSPQILEVDGFEAVRDGRSIYVAAAREGDMSLVTTAGDPATVRALYSNIYILSYNQSASAQTRSIFEQMISNLQFLETFDSSPAVCSLDGATPCESDLDCAGAGNTCGDVKAKIARDLSRITDLNRMARSIEESAIQNGRCNGSGAACSVDADCVGGEFCQASAPVLDSGTFIPGLSASSWTSWRATLGSVVPDLAIDPLNRYAVDANLDPTCLPADGVTCYNESSRTYSCDPDSFVYHYSRDARTTEQEYRLTAHLEYGGAYWGHALPNYTLGSLEIATDYDQAALIAPSDPFASRFVRSSSVCTGGVLGESSICGDGIVGSAEVCEPGDPIRYASCSYENPADATADPIPGQLPYRCNASCDGFVAVADPGVEIDPDAVVADPDSYNDVCRPASCGNGVLEPGEDCDDGVDNGRYGFCSTTCSYDDAPRCGDGQLDAGEACDCGAFGVAGGRSMDGGICGAGVYNGTYTTLPGNGCSSNCQGSASYCGDLLVNGAEKCDGGVEFWGGATCNDANNSPCTTDADCATGSCGDGYSACTPDRVCQSGDPAKIGFACDSVSTAFGGTNQTPGVNEDSDCDSFVGGVKIGDGLCSPQAVERVRSRACRLPSESSACTYRPWSSTCVSATACGNGVVETGEECDDGNRDNSDSCTNVCRLNVCGDGFLFQGIEACDNGVLNGQSCDAAYDASCSYCSSTCRLTTVSGPYCGDGVHQPSAELCDTDQFGNTVPVLYRFVAPSGLLGGACNENEFGAAGPDIGDETSQCHRVGVCNGGSRTGQTCLLRYGSSPYTSSNFSCSGGGTCVAPSCGDACQAACPFTYDSSQVTFVDEFEGSTRQTRVTLVKDQGEFDPDRPEETRAAVRATLQIPACRLAADMLGDIDFEIDRPSKAYVMFVNDMSGSMNGGNLTTLKTSLEDAFDTLYDELGDNVEVGLATYGTNVDEYRYPYMNSLGGTTPNPGVLDSDTDGTPDGLDSDVGVAGFGSGIRYQDLLDGSLIGWGQVSDFMPASQKSRLQQIVRDFRPRFCTSSSPAGYAGRACSGPADCGPTGSPGTCANPGTVTSVGLLHGLYAHEKLQASRPGEDARRIIILMTDGNFNPSWSPSYLSCITKDKGYELYTIRLGASGTPTLNPATPTPTDCGSITGGGNYLDYTAWTGANPGTPTTSSCSGLLKYTSQSGWTGTDRLNHLACTSSGNPDSVNGLKYVYSGTTATQFRAAFRQIVATIVGAQIEYTISDGLGGTDISTVEVREGSGTVPYPSGFICNPAAAQDIPFVMSFYGEGSVTLSNFRVNLCRP